MLEFDFEIFHFAQLQNGFRGGKIRDRETECKCSNLSEGYEGQSQSRDGQKLKSFRRNNQNHQFLKKKKKWACELNMYVYFCIIKQELVIYSMLNFLGSVSDRFCGRTDPSKKQVLQMCAGSQPLLAFSASPSERGNRTQTALFFIRKSGPENVSTHSHHLIKRTWDHLRSLCSIMK